MHVSGHGYQEDLKLMLTLMKPTYFIPIHGEYRMLHHHQLLAESVGVEVGHTFIVKNGDVVDIQGAIARQTRSVPAGDSYVDGSSVGETGSAVLRDRKQLSQDGMLIIIITLDKSNHKIITGPDIITRGFIYVRHSEDLLKVLNKLVKSVLDDLSEAGISDWKEMKQAISKDVGQYVFKHLKMKPVLLPVIIEV